MYLDSLGLIVTHTGDGGDTAQNEGMYSIPYNILYPSIIKVLEPNQDGIWVRHPIQYPDPKDFSRDQATSNIIAMGFYNAQEPLKRMLKQQIKRYGLYQNGDIPAPDNIGQMFRALDWKFTYPLLWLTDLFMLANVLIVSLIKARTPNAIQQWLGKNVSYLFMQGEPNNSGGVPQDVYGSSNVGTDKNLIAALYQAQVTMATPISLIARKLYKKLRPGGVFYPLELYYAVDNPEIAQSWNELLEKF